MRFNCTSLVVLVVTYIGISNYVAYKQVNKIQEDLAEVIEATDPTEIIKEKNEENIEQAREEELDLNNIKLISNPHLASLLSVNEDVVGELVVNNTNIKLPRCSS